jgi:hypothetical protein
VVAHHPVPIQEDIRDLLGDLLGCGIAVDKTAPLELDEGTPGVVASYVTADGDVGALCVLDASCVVLVAAALVMVPPTVAKEQVSAGSIEENHLDVAHEVVNVLARLLNTPRTPHLRLEALHRVPGELPDQVAALLASPEFRRDFVATIEGYGEGRVGILVR